MAQWQKKKNPPASTRATGDADSIPGSGRCPGEGNGTHSSTLAWRTPWAEEPGGLYSPWGHRESGMTEQQQHTLVCFLQFFKMSHIIPVLKIMRQNNDKKRHIK